MQKKEQSEVRCIVCGKKIDLRNVDPKIRGSLARRNICSLKCLAIYRRKLQEENNTIKNNEVKENES